MSGRLEMTPTLSIEELTVGFVQQGETIEAVDGVSLCIAPSECVGVVGESGSGKTQLFMAAMGLLAGNARSSGNIRFEGNELLGAPPAVLNRVRGSRLTMIFQDPMTCLTPHLRIGTQLAEIMVHHRRASWDEARAAAVRMLERVQVSEPRRRMNQFPYELSGGMRQRVMLAMSLLCEPSLLIADEPTTALDVTIQAQIMQLLRAVRGEFGMAMALISHDLAVVAGLADRILVMYAGKIVESAPAQELFRAPRHPYTAELLKCIPRVFGARLARLPSLAGQAPRPGEKLPACAFAPRCPRAADRCRSERPLLMGADRQVACHFPLAP
ncbi:MAG TPA: ABC transporter ATP-binding protein [Steroidobacteraceae bacterium]|nr:ABC transporter ATP-binding protein [Steroidobacteraceae bacterium]